MPLTERENFLETASFGAPEYMPAAVHISSASWDEYRDDMENVLARHPILWPGFVKGRQVWDKTDFGPAYTKGAPFTDSWGCTWETSVNGIEGVVTRWPLRTWEDYPGWSPPDPLRAGDRGPVDWDAIRRDVAAAKAAGHLTTGGPPHGFHFMRLTYVRGFENMMFDMALEEPGLLDLIEDLYRHNEVIVRQYLDMGVDYISLAEDLGAQTASVISPEMFRRYCRPTYERLIQPCREQGMHVWLHSDGYIMDLVDDLLMAGVTIMNPQDLCNGIDNIRRTLKNRVCIYLDIDRQKIVPYGTRQEIRELIEEEVKKLGSPKGGLMMVAGIYPPTSPDNVDALACALEEYRTYWFDGGRTRC